MRSIWAVAAALTMLLAFPIAIVASVFGENVPEIVVHIVLGVGMLLLSWLRPNWSWELNLTLAAIPLLLLVPTIFRYSRVLWMYFDVPLN